LAKEESSKSSCWPNRRHFLAVGKQVITNYWDRNTWTGGRPVIVATSPRRWSRANELLAMSRPKPKVAAGLTSRHTTLKAHMFKLGLTQRQDCRLCTDGKKNCNCTSTLKLTPNVFRAPVGNRPTIYLHKPAGCLGGQWGPDIEPSPTRGIFCIIDFNQARKDRASTL
jgi:hypothetical protein